MAVSARREYVSLELSLPRKYVKKLWRAIVEFELLQPGDRVLVSFSGGKDSAFLLYALAVVKKYSPFPLELGAVHIDLGFETPSDVDPMAEFCRELQVPFYLEKTRIAEKAFNHRQQNPCPRCAFFRRGAVNQRAVAEGYNKVALAHHHDDAVVTFLMSQLYSGQLKTFLPKTKLERTGLTVIRPLVYLREAEIKRAVGLFPYTPMYSRCPLAGKTQRETVKRLIRELTRENRFVYGNLAAAMREGPHVELWPSLPSREEMHERHLRVMQPNASNSN